jgi:hypothetical protein
MLTDDPHRPLQRKAALNGRLLIAQEAVSLVGESLAVVILQV